MLDPAHDKPAGSFQRAECLGNELGDHVERVADAVDQLAAVIKRLMAEDLPPRTLFSDPPCGSSEAFLVLCCGIDVDE